VIRVLIADDQALVRSGFEVLLQSADDIEVVGVAADGAQALAEAARLHPDVVLMDIRMPVMDGLEATRRLVAADPDVRVLVLTTFDLDEYVFEALRSGASGFLLKDALPGDLLDAVRVVAAGEALLSPRATRLLVEQFAARPRPATRPGALAALTDREREVLALVADGLSNAEISARLVVGAATTKTHIAHLLAKLGARDRAQLVVAAFTGGLMDQTRG
jgi:DNA-binding NarL/FixJ family response regulator